MLFTSKLKLGNHNNTNPTYPMFTNNYVQMLNWQKTVEYSTRRTSMTGQWAFGQLVAVILSYLKVIAVIIEIDTL
jgi:hypothetical protein